MWSIWLRFDHPTVLRYKDVCKQDPEGREHRSSKLGGSGWRPQWLEKDRESVRLEERGVDRTAMGRDEWAQVAESRFLCPQSQARLFPVTTATCRAWFRIGLYSHTWAATQPQDLLKTDDRDEYNKIKENLTICSVAGQPWNISPNVRQSSMEVLFKDLPHGPNKVK